MKLTTQELVDLRSAIRVATTECTWLLPRSEIERLEQLEARLTQEIGPPPGHHYCDDRR